MSVFDRTWYGRVLVERVEGFASETEWERAYGQIVEFERGLVAEGMVLVKLWLHISRRRAAPALSRARAQPAQALEADRRGLAQPRAPRPSTSRRSRRCCDAPTIAGAPWHVIAAESKPLARLAVLGTVIEALEAGLRAAGHDPVQVEAKL